MVNVNKTECILLNRREEQLKCMKEASRLTTWRKERDNNKVEKDYLKMFMNRFESEAWKYGYKNKVEIV